MTWKKITVWLQLYKTQIPVLEKVTLLGCWEVCVLPGVGVSVGVPRAPPVSICHHDSVLYDIHRKAIISVNRWIRELPAVTKRQCKDWFQTDFSTVYRFPDLSFCLFNILALQPWIQCMDSCFIYWGQKSSTAN